MKSVYNKIYILAPYNHHTGGVELAHQLIHKLREFGQDAYVVYIKDLKISHDQSITAEYKKYNIQSTSLIEDTKDNLIVLPEIYFDFIRNFKNISIGCWWMSVDNRYKNCNLWDIILKSKNFRHKLSAIKHWKKYKANVSDSEIRQYQDRITHFYQSVYAMVHLYNTGFYKVAPLGDYINKSFILDGVSPSISKENIVLYNPAKGYSFTKKIIDRNPDIQFIPLKGFSRSELTEIMKKSKIYIDFGNFPGKDRLSREAASQNNIIITGTLGASGFYEDVPIPSKYKFEVKDNNISTISDMIHFALDNYEHILPDFETYRSTILNEEKDFENQIRKSFFV